MRLWLKSRFGTDQLVANVPWTTVHPREVQLDHGVNRRDAGELRA